MNNNRVEEIVGLIDDMMEAYADTVSVEEVIAAIEIYKIRLLTEGSFRISITVEQTHDNNASDAG